jgi:hypothetical protein
MAGSRQRKYELRSCYLRTTRGKRPLKSRALEKCPKPSVHPKIAQPRIFNATSAKLFGSLKALRFSLRRGRAEDDCGKLPNDHGSGSASARVLSIRLRGNKTPGVLVPFAMLAATANPISLIAMAVAGTTKIYGENTGSNTIEGASKQTADAIATELRGSFEKQGWIQPNEKETAWNSEQ